VLLHLADTCTLLVSRIRTNFGSRAAAPRVWNCVPPDFRQRDLLYSCETKAQYEPPPPLTAR